MLRRTRRSTDLATFALFILSLFVAPASGRAAPVAETGDASISRDQTAGTWTLSAGGASLTLTLDPARDFLVTRLASSSGVNWVTAPLPDSVITIGTQIVALGNRAAGFTLADVNVETE